MATLLSSSASVCGGNAALNCAGRREAASARRPVAISASAQRADETCDAVSRRSVALAATTSALGLFLALPHPARALLEDDDDTELLQRVKSVRKERIIKQKEEAVSPEGEAFQSLVSELRTVGQALDARDFPSAAQTAADAYVLVAPGGKVDEAAKKLNAKSALIVSLRSGVKDLQSALSAGDDASAKQAFVASASALQEITDVTGLTSSLVGF